MIVILCIHNYISLIFAVEWSRTNDVDMQKGQFLIITVVLCATALAVFLLWSWIMAIAVLVMAGASGGAVWTNMIDGCNMNSDGTTAGGVKCDRCDEVTPLKPWSM